MNIACMRSCFAFRGALVAAAIAWAVALVPPAIAGPIFPLPPGSHVPGFGIHLVTGIGVLPPGGALPAIPFADFIASPDPHHWELELHNPNPFPMMFTATFIAPGGPYAADIGLLPGMSVLLDVHYMDAPEMGPPGTWVMTASSSPLMPGPITVDAMVIEYPMASGAMPGFGPPVFSAPGGFFGPPTGLPGPTFGVPAPATLALLALAGLALPRSRHRRRPPRAAS